jgi:hypothetical protein
MRCKGDQPMKKSIRHSVKIEKAEITVGIDLGDRFSRYCMVNGAGEVVEEGRIATTREAFGKTLFWGSKDADRHGMRDPFAVGEPLIAGHGT